MICEHYSQFLLHPLEKLGSDKLRTGDLVVYDVNSLGNFKHVLQGCIGIVIGIITVQRMGIGDVVWDKKVIVLWSTGGSR